MRAQVRVIEHFRRYVNSRLVLDVELDGGVAAAQALMVQAPGQERLPAAMRHDNDRWLRLLRRILRLRKPLSGRRRRARVLWPYPYRDSAADGSRSRA